MENSKKVLKIKLEEIQKETHIQDLELQMLKKKYLDDCNEMNNLSILMDRKD